MKQRQVRKAVTSGSPVKDKQAVLSTAQKRKEARLDEALMETFPASDPVAIAVDEAELGSRARSEEGTGS